jgi:exosome complex component RRP43
MSSAVSEKLQKTDSEDLLRAATFQRLHPRAYLERFLAEGIRPDGRDSAAFRDVTVNVGALYMYTERDRSHRGVLSGSISTADGSALVRLGDTTIVCGVKAEIAEPEVLAPSDGFIVPNIDLSAICSPKFKPGPPSEEAQVLSDRLHEILTS